MLVLTSLDDLVTSFFTNLGKNFTWTSFFILLTGVLIGMILFTSIYGILMIVSIKTDKRLKNLEKSTNTINDEILKEKIKEIKKQFKKDTAGFTVNEKMKVLGSTIFETVNVIAGEYYPESKYPLYELTVDELLQFLHYISDRISLVFDRKLLKPFREMSVSQVFRFLDTKKRLENNKAVKAANKIHIGKVSNFFFTVLNYANPVYWFKRLILGGTISAATNKIALIIIDIVADETNKTYSKRIFNKEISLNKEEIDAVLDEFDKESEENIDE